MCDATFFSIIFLQLFVICKIAVGAGCQHYNADDFSDEPDLNIAYQFNIVTKTYSLVEI